MAPQHSESITVKSQYPQSSREARPKLAPQHCEATTKATPRCITPPQVPQGSTSKSGNKPFKKPLQKPPLVVSHSPRSSREAHPKVALQHLESHNKNSHIVSHRPRSSREARPKDHSSRGHHRDKAAPSREQDRGRRSAHIRSSKAHSDGTAAGHAQRHPEQQRRPSRRCVCVCLCVYIRVCVCVCVCMRVYVYL